MESIVGHLDTFRALYVVGGTALAVIGGFCLFDVVSARRHRVDGRIGQAPDHTRSVHKHGPWAGMDESGPEV
jgi:hypothetical protein